MRQRIIMILCLIALASTAYAQDDPALAAQIKLVQTPMKIKSLASQDAANTAMSGEMYLGKKYIDAATKEIERYNLYLETMKNDIREACVVYGLFLEAEQLISSFNYVTGQIKDAPSNAVALAMSPSRGQSYLDVFKVSTSVIMDLQNLLGINVSISGSGVSVTKGNKLSEADRIRIETSMRPKIHDLTRRLRRLGTLIKYTSLASVWQEYTGGSLGRRASDDDILAKTHRKWIDSAKRPRLQKWDGSKQIGK